MSRTSGSRPLRRRPSRTVPASIVATVVLAAGVLTVVVAVSRLATGRWPLQVTGPAAAVADLTWGSTAVLVAAVATAVVGLVLLVAGTKPGRPTSAQLRSPHGDLVEQADFVITNRAMARLAAAQADLVDGVDTMSATASGRRVHLSVTTSSEQTTQIHDRVVAGVVDTLTSVGVQPLPRVTATVRTKEI